MIRRRWGTYRNQEPNGDPISEKGTHRTHFMPMWGTPMLIGITTFDDGTGPVLINDPAVTYLVAAFGHDAYRWTTMGEEFAGFFHPEADGFYMEYTHGDGGEDQYLERE